jgi:hypothetical protein
VASRGSRGKVEAPGEGKALPGAQWSPVLQEGRENGEELRLILPYALREKLFKALHEDQLEGGHFGFEKTMEKIKKRFTFKGMDEDVKKLIDSCDVCQKRKILPN